MKKLVFETLNLLSKQERAGRRVAFTPKNNAVLGGNDTGKSTILKSLYHVFGATPAKLTTNWKTTDEICYLRFRIDQDHYQMLRYQDYFGLFDSESKLLGAFEGITRENGIADRLGEMLGASIKIQDRGGKFITPSPALYFLPYYLDQDEGWSNIWDSFSGVDQISDFKKTMVDYHIGIRPRRYYEISQDMQRMRAVLETTRRERDSLLNLKKQMAESEGIEASFDPIEYQREVDGLLAKYETLRSMEEEYKEKITKLESERLLLSQQVEIAERVGGELAADYDFLHNAAKSDDHVNCPACGAAYANGLADRFPMLGDVQKCEALIISLRDRILALTKKMKEVRGEYELAGSGLKELDNRLAKRTERVQLHEVVHSEGMREARKLFDKNLDVHAAQVSRLEDAIKEIEKERASLTDKKRSTEIISSYKARVTGYLQKLDVKTIRSEHLESPSGKMPTSGSDLPRAVLAQFFGILHTMHKYSGAYVACPIIVDSPIQQDPDPQNIAKIIRFVIDEKPPDSQLILGSVSLHGIDFEGNRISLSEKNMLLEKSEYRKINDHLSPMLDLIFKKLA